MPRFTSFETLATHLMREHGLVGWSFGWDRAVRRAGRCVHTKKYITVSKYFAEEASAGQFQQVMLHEVAHALAGHSAGHGREWLRIARGIGYHGGRTLEWEYAKHHAPWLGLCPSGHETTRFRRPSKEVSCGRCSKMFNPKYRVTWHRVRP